MLHNYMYVHVHVCVLYMNKCVCMLCAKYGFGPSMDFVAQITDSYSAQ